MAAVAAVAVAIVAVVVGRRLHEFAAQRLGDVALVLQKLSLIHI